MSSSPHSHRNHGRALRRFAVAMAAIAAMMTTVGGPVAADRGTRHSPTPETPSVGVGPRSDVERPTDPNSVSLEILPAPGSATDVAPPIPIPPFESDPSDDDGGAWVPSDFGCMSGCITSAQLTSNPFNPDVELTMTTSVLATKSVWILPPGPFVVDGLPAHAGVSPVAVSGSGNDFQHTIEGLSPETTYRIVIGAVDDLGNSQLATTVFTTAAGMADDFAADGTPCTFGCIESGYVSYGDSYDHVLIDVTASGEVTFELAVSTTAPWYLWDDPVVSDDVPVDVGSVTATSFSGEMSGLQPETTYYVLVTATDDHGIYQKALGQFTTLAAPPPLPLPGPDDETTTVYVHFERAHIHETGDLIGKGEMQFRFGFVSDQGSAYGWEPYQTLAEGDGLDLEDGGYLEVGADEIMPPFIVNAIESDPGGPTDLLCPDGGPYPLFLDPLVLDCGGEATSSPAVLEGMTLAWMETLNDCAQYNVTGIEGAGKCIVVSSHGTGHWDYITYDVLIAFLVIED